MAWLYIPATLLAAYIIHTLYNLGKNYLVARRIGAPMMISFFAPYTPMNQLTGKGIRRFTMRCPWPISEWGKCGFYGWSYLDEGKTHEKLGPVFVLVTSSRNLVIVADPAAVKSALARYRQFRKIPGQVSIALFGPNVVTVEDDVWSRHRKLTAPAFNEKSSRLVWQESLKQGKGMIQSFVAAGAAGTTSLQKDVQTVALHVLTKVGFGVENDFGEGVSRVHPGYKLPFRDTIQLILRQAIVILIIGRKNLLSRVMPAGLQKLGTAVEEYDRYIRSLLQDQRKAIAQGTEPQNNLLNVLIRASDTEKDSGHASQTLSDEEIRGNTFIFNVAGHDTTANTLAFAIAMLAGYPEVQNWLSEEINTVLGNDENPDYEESYPKLVRCLATMYETLRLFSAVPENPKYTWANAPTLAVGNKDYAIPPDTYVQLNFTAMFTSPRDFPPDPLVWRPSRFVLPSPTSSSSPATTDEKPVQESLWDPPRGTFIPFSDGPRNCLGRKFAMVEFVAVIATLFRRHRVRPKRVEGESEAEARERVIGMAKDAWTGGVVLRMRDPARVGLVWEGV